MCLLASCLLACFRVQCFCCFGRRPRPPPGLRCDNHNKRERESENKSSNFFLITSSSLSSASAATKQNLLKSNLTPLLPFLRHHHQNNHNHNNNHLIIGESQTAEQLESLEKASRFILITYRSSSLAALDLKLCC
mgnify:CR=1 FL=1